MSMSILSPMIMSKFQYILQRKIGKSHPELYEEVRSLCGPYPIFRLKVRFTEQDTEKPDTYDVSQNLSDEEILELQQGEDQTQETLEREKWSKCLYNDDVDIITLLFKRICDNVVLKYSGKIGRLRVGIHGTYDDMSSENVHFEELMYKECNVNRKDFSQRV